MQTPLSQIPKSVSIVSPPPLIVNETVARRSANGYLGMDVGIAFSAINGTYIPLDNPLWQFLIRFDLPGLGTLGILGTIDVNAKNGQVVPLTDTQIRTIRDRANAIVQFQTQTTAA